MSQAAENLVEQHLSLVDALARKILRSLPSFVELDDLVGFGRIGLVEASRRFDPSRGVLFKTFAYYRIRGAIYDGIRKMAWFEGSSSRGVTYQAASNEIMGEANTQAASNRGVATLEEQIEQTREMIESLATAKLLSLDAPETTLELPDERESPYEIAELSELASLMRACLTKLDDKERSVIEDYYFNHLTLEEAGAKLGLSKSWTSRLHARALRKLLKLCLECGIRAPS